MTTTTVARLFAAITLTSLLCVGLPFTYAGPKAAKPPPKSTPVAPPVADDPEPGTPAYRLRLCTSYGGLAADIARARDRGVALSQIIAVLRNGKSTEMADHMEGMAVEVYRKIWLTPTTARQEAEVGCFASQAVQSAVR